MPISANVFVSRFRLQYDTKHCATSRHTDCNALGGSEGREKRVRKRQSEMMISPRRVMHCSRREEDVTFLPREESGDGERPVVEELFRLRRKGDELGDTRGEGSLDLYASDELFLQGQLHHSLVSIRKAPNLVERILQPRLSERSNKSRS